MPNMPSESLPCMQDRSEKCQGPNLRFQTPNLKFQSNVTSLNLVLEFGIWFLEFGI